MPEPKGLGYLRRSFEAALLIRFTAKRKAQVQKRGNEAKREVGRVRLRVGKSRARESGGMDMAPLRQPAASPEASPV